MKDKMSLLACVIAFLLVGCLIWNIYLDDQRDFDEDMLILEDGGYVI